MNSDADMDPVAAGARQRLWWIAGWFTLLALAALIVLFWNTASAAVSVWAASETYTHAFLVGPIVAYLIWDRRARFGQVEPRPSLWGLGVILGSGAAWLVANAASIQEGQQFALMGMIQGLLLTVLGWRVYKAFLFPFLYLFFMVPSGDFLIAPLQDFTAQFAVQALRVVGVPVYIDGLFIAIPNGLFEVAEACAGVRFLIASVAFGFLYANLVYRSPVRRGVFLALSVVVPIIANGFRAFGIILVAYLSDNTIAVAADHIIYGWVFFSVVLLALIWIGMQFREDIDADDDGPVAPNGGAGRQASPTALALATGLSLAAAVVAPAWSSVARDLATTPELASLSAPVAPPPWRAADAVADWQPSYPGADKLIHQVYRDTDGRQVDLVVAFYATQRDGVEAISNKNRIADGEIWSVASRGRARLTIDGVERSVSLTRLRGRTSTRVVVRWHWVGGRYAFGTLKAKLNQARGELLGGTRSAAAVILSAPYEESPAEAVAAIQDLLDAIGPIAPRLAQAGGGATG